MRKKLKLKPKTKTKDKEFQKSKTIFTGYIFSIDDKNNLKYLDSKAYQAYLEHLNSKGGD